MAHSRGHVASSCLRRTLSAATIVSSGEKLAGGVRRLAAGLVEYGIGVGGVVAVAALNSDEYIELFLAVTYIGAIVAPLNHRWSFEEARSAMEVVQPTMLAVDGSCFSWAVELRKSNCLPSLALYLLLGDHSPARSSFGSFLTVHNIKSSSRGMITLEPSWAPKDIALICFTSGTTGRPKGAAISHTSLIVQSLAKIAIIGYGEDDVYLHAAPLCHIGGISSCIAMLMVGARHVLLPKFDAESAFKAIKERKVTSFIAVPAMMADLVSYSRVSELEGVETVTKILNGGGGLSEELVEGASRLFPRATICSAYGMTEACSSLTFMTLRNPTLQKPRELLQSKYVIRSELHCPKQEGVCVGKAAPHVELRISGDQNSNSNSNSSYGSRLVGKILTRGLHVMVGYWDRSEAILLDSIEHGWLDTGDIGWIDGDGDLWLMGREKGRIKSGGENVYPEEVEAVLAQHPGIAKAVVVGAPDVRLTEKVVACVITKDEWSWVGRKSNHSESGKELSAEILQRHCRERNLSRFKIPKSYVVWKKPFPVTTTGKIRREDVKREVTSCMHVPSNL
ncbi:2-succinylbenzoate--CoA ligase, chloroplastic/peroxisomal isoform X2 [Ananas comosus]|uniref:4-coumarate--CoA ligase n=1 Tax=Ananas comosus TaxID=4615 RepID=A0A6P5G404_ANACO|nr:2-succinylbenzoate--CoA ligase, chloroplastic/peroxisomal isoform X2 [Ananas comosus]